MSTNHRKANGRVSGADGDSLRSGASNPGGLNGNCPDTVTNGSSMNRRPDILRNLLLVEIFVRSFLQQTATIERR